MSIETTLKQEQTEQAGPCTAIDLMIHPREHDIGSLVVRRVLPTRGRRMVGPWIFFDHMGPASFEPGQGVDVRPHPHINLATVTYLFGGEMLHRDSLGNELAIKPGEINLMVAGRGIVHSERQREEIKAAGNFLDGLQLWLALPEADEEMDPEFHHYDREQIPAVEINGVAMRVLIGSAYGMESPVRTFAETLYLEASLKAGQRLTLPDGVDERAIYVVKGRLTALDSEIDQYSMAVLHSGHTVTVEALEDTQLALIGGERLGHRHIWWNFVSSRTERIEQAKQDWKNGAFPTVPGDEVEFIPLPE
jgi:redox-sensitive bicupin YhaK (pirin superfamily)